MSNEAIFVGIGSNQNMPIEQLINAISALQRSSEVTLTACSGLYASQPMGPKDQPDYVNAVVKLTTNLAPFELLSFLQSIEQTQGRVRNGQRWGPRTLDLDILLIGNKEIQTDDLTVPHYGIREREFVLYPLAEIAPGLSLPNGEKVAQLVSACPRRGLSKLDVKVELSA